MSNIYLVTGQQELFENNFYKIITVEESLRLLDSCNILQYDSETNGKDCHISKLLCFQFGNKEKDIQIVVDASTISPIIYKKIFETKYLIMQNGA